MAEKVLVFEGAGNKIYAQIMPQGTVIGGIENWYASAVTPDRGMLVIKAKDLAAYSDADLASKAMKKEDSTVINGLSQIAVIDVTKPKASLGGPYHEAKPGTKVALGLAE